MPPGKADVAKEDGVPLEEVIVADKIGERKRARMLKELESLEKKPMPARAKGIARHFGESCRKLCRAMMTLPPSMSESIYTYIFRH